MKLSHVGDNNQPQMVDVTSKSDTVRQAIASCTIKVPFDLDSLLKEGVWQTKKGPILDTAIIAGTMAVKKTSDLIPFCHNIPLGDIKIKIESHTKDTLKILCKVKTHGQTGVEMEALTGATVAGLTIYDMCKAVSHDITLSDVKLEQKSGGKKDFDRILN